MKQDTLFKNIVGTVNKSGLFPFKLNNRLNPESARYFLIKKAYKTKINEEGIKENHYYDYVYSTGILKQYNKPLRFPMCLNIWGSWRNSINKEEFLNEEMLEIDMKN